MFERRDSLVSSVPVAQVPLKGAALNLHRRLLVRVWTDRVHFPHHPGMASTATGWSNGAYNLAEVIDTLSNDF